MFKNFLGLFFVFWLFMFISLGINFFSTMSDAKKMQPQIEKIIKNAAENNQSGIILIPTR